GLYGFTVTWVMPLAWSSSVATASTALTPRSMPVYHIQLNMTDLRSPAAAAFEVDGGVVRWAQATCTPVNTIASRTANCSGGLFLRLRAIARGLRGPPTVRQFKDSARCCAGASRTAATV